MTMQPPRPNRKQHGQRSCQVRNRLRHGQTMTKYVDVRPFELLEGRLLPSDENNLNSKDQFALIFINARAVKTKKFMNSPQTTNQSHDIRHGFHFRCRSICQVRLPNLETNNSL